MYFVCPKHGHVDNVRSNGVLYFCCHRVRRGFKKDVCRRVVYQVYATMGARGRKIFKLRIRG